MNNWTLEHDECWYATDIHAFLELFGIRVSCYVVLSLDASWCRHGHVLRRRVASLLAIVLCHFEYTSQVVVKHKLSKVLFWEHWTGSAIATYLQVKYNQLGVGDPAFTYGIMFVPENAVKLTLPLVQDKKLGRGCFWYTVRPALWMQHAN